jgi:hypothetical protein
MRTGGRKESGQGYDAGSLVDAMELKPHLGPLADMIFLTGTIHTRRPSALAVGGTDQ